MPHRVKTETGVLVTISDDFFDPEVHEEVGGDGNESPLLPDGTYRPPTYPVEDDRQEGGEHDQDSDGQTAESTEENG